MLKGEDDSANGGCALDQLLQYIMDIKSQTIPTWSRSQSVLIA